MRRRYRITTLVLLVGVSAGSLKFYVWSSKPAVTTPPPVSANVEGAATPDLSTKLASNAYFSAQFPTRFNIRRSTDGSGNPVYLQQLYVSNSDSNLYSDQIAITIGKLPSDGLKGVSDVQLRSTTREYNQLFFQWLPDADALAYERSSQGYELGIFMSHGSYYIDIVATGIIANKDQTIHEMQMLVSSLVFK